MQWVGLISLALVVIGAMWRFSLAVTNRQTEHEQQLGEVGRTVKAVGRIAVRTRRDVRGCRADLDRLAERVDRHVLNGRPGPDCPARRVGRGSS